MKNKKILFAFFLLVFLIPFVEGKSYTLDKAKIDIAINSDSSLNIDERITFNFNGPFTFAYRDFDYNDEVIDSIKVYDDKSGAELKTEITQTDSNTKIVKWLYNANNEIKTFRISYKLKNALKIYNDVAEFNWKIWGSGWDHSLGEIEGDFELPKKASSNLDVYTWVHPNLNGKIAILENKTVIFQAFDIPSQQWVELRVVFPANLISSSTFAKRINSDGLQNILNEEEAYKNQKNILDTISDTEKRWFIVFFIAPSIFIIGLFLLLYFLLGREPKVNYEQEYEREVPYNYSPAVVSALINQHNKKPVARDFVAEILNLCLKGYLKLKVINKKKILGIFGSDIDYEILIQKKDKARLKKHEAEVLSAIKGYASGDKITFDGLKAEIQSDSMGFRKKFKEWQDQVKEEAIAEGFFSKNNAYMWFNIISIVLVVIGFMVPILAWNLLIAGIIGLVINNIFRQALPRRSEKGALHYKRWMSLKRFLNDFSLIKERPPESMILWEKYLVYAVSLGVADKVQKAMKMIIPTNQQARSGIFIGYVNYHALNMGHFVSSVNNFSSSFATASGTSGGGFSGGGGGGGGGGGVGAG